MTKEIIGSEPPIIEIKNIFEKELVNLLEKLKSIPIEDLENLLEQQLKKIGDRLVSVLEESKKSDESTDSVAGRISWERINS